MNPMTTDRRPQTADLTLDTVAVVEVISSPLPSAPVLTAQREARIVEEIHGLLASAEDSEGRIKAILLAQVTRLVRVATLVAEVKESLPHGTLGAWLDARFGRRVKTIKRWLPVVQAIRERNPELLAALPAMDSDPEQLTLFGAELFKLAGLAEPEDFKLTHLQRWGVAALRPPPRVRAPKPEHGPERQLEMRRLLAGAEWGKATLALDAHGANFVFLDDAGVRAQIAALKHHVAAREHWLSLRDSARGEQHLNHTAARLRGLVPAT